LAVYWWWHIVVLAGVKARCVHLCQVAGKNCVIPHGKCHSVAVRWNSINSYIPPLPWVDWKWRTGKRGPKKNKSRKILTEKCRTSNLWRSECGKWRTNLWWSQKVENGEPFYLYGSLCISGHTNKEKAEMRLNGIRRPSL